MITVFTPIYNRKQLVPRLYDSLKKQTDKSFIWLIVDDGSKDGTGKLIKELIGKNEIKIQYIYQENSGKHVAHNTAVANCNTKYMLILDSDDLLDVDAIKILNKKVRVIANNSEISGIIGNRFRIDSGEVIGKKIPNIKYASGVELYQKYGFKGDTLRLYKTEILKKHMFPVIEGEKFIYENVVFDQIDSQYKMMTISDKLYYSEYLADGYTKNQARVKKENPRGYALSLLSAAKNSVVIENKIKIYILYYIWIKKMNIEDATHNIILKTALFPICTLLTIAKKPKTFFGLFEK